MTTKKREGSQRSARRRCVAGAKGIGQVARRFALLGHALLLCTTLALPGCKKPRQAQSVKPPDQPTLRLYVASSIAGAIEPCGCRKDMLGGVDHAATLIESEGKQAPNSLLLGAGPMLFLNPELDATRAQQDRWKAESLAQSLKDLGLVAWAPGHNDFADGVVALNTLLSQTRAKLLANNLEVDSLPVATEFIVERGGLKIGVAGASMPKLQGVLPQGVKALDPQRALMVAHERLKAKGAQVYIALVAAQRGQALRLAELVPGYQVMVVGKAFDRGEANDAPTPPVRIDGTLVVESPNHLQALSVLDLYAREGSYEFQDATGVDVEQKRASLERRKKELKARIEQWSKNDSIKAEDLSARKNDLASLTAQAASLKVPGVPSAGSYFRYKVLEVNEQYAPNSKLQEQLRAYYKRVNEHNKEAFKDRKPVPAAKGEARYVGISECVDCHKEAYQFWLTTGHAKAYETLEVDFKEFNLDCVGCHVTGYEKPGGSTVTFVDGLKDVQCESCHGPGSIHSKNEEEDDIVLTTPKEWCKKCHHAPHVADDWDVDEAWEHIIGPGHGD